MDTRKQDTRACKTRMRLRAGLTQLLRDKPVRDITVRELTELVGINRCTFYLHYHDMFELAEHVEREVTEEVAAMLRAHPMPDVRERPRTLLAELFEYLARNAGLCAALLDLNGDMAFFSRLMELVRGHFLEGWLKREERGAAPFDYVFAYVTSGCAGAFRAWFHAGMRETPEEMAALIERIMLRGIGVPERPRAEGQNTTDRKESDS